jgi:hypothetical protein
VTLIYFYDQYEAKKLVENQTIINNTILNDTLVGSDRDEHGCIGSAGYSWCDNLKECIRPWETVCV